MAECRAGGRVVEVEENGFGMVGVDDLFGGGGEAG
jgi:hypothetical protein